MRLAVICLLAFAGCAARPAAIHPVPLVHAHAHNDYAHGRPLKEAIECGFCSVEVDVHLVNGELLVAHDREQVTPGRTLEALYLEPLRVRIASNHARVFDREQGFTLLIDIKSDDAGTYPLLRKTLRRYADILTTYQRGRRRDGAVAVVLTGKRPPAQSVAREVIRYVALDGTLEELDQNWPTDLMPQINADWRAHFQWRGEGAMPAEQRRRLRELVDRAHHHGKRIRFWRAPDQPRVWAELLDAGVDLINSDDLTGLRDFLRARQAGNRAPAAARSSATAAAAPAGRTPTTRSP